MATVSFTRESETEIYYSIRSAYSSSSYTYAVQVKSNSSGNWITKEYASVSSSGRASGTVGVNDNSAYYCRVVEYYNDEVNAYIPYTAGTRVAAYVEETEYSGYISKYTVDGYYGTEDVPYYGRINVKVVITEGAETGWYLQVNNSTANRTYISSSGTYTIGLDNLYNGGGTTYVVKLIDPDGEQQDYTNVSTLETPTVTHSLFYLANGGSGAPSTQTVTVVAWDDPHYFTVSYTEPTREGYIFLGWSKSSSASSASYSGGDSIGVSGQVTLYAVWEQEPSTYYLIFDANGGTGAPSTKSASSYNDYYTFNLSNYSLSTPTRSGYVFKGWGTSASSTTTATSFTAYASSGYSVTAYAVWELAAQLKAPNITSLTISGVSSSGFSVSATQDNLETGYWVIEISTGSGFGSVISSNAVGYLQKTLSYSFTGLAANTLYYIRVKNYDTSGNYAVSTTTWRQWTGIAAFAWTSDDAAQVVAGAEFSDVITASAWNTLGDKISAVSRRQGGGSVTLTTVYSGTTALTAQLFDDVRNAIAGLSGAGSVPEVVYTGDAVLSAQFANAAASLKNAINRAISALNN